MFKKILIIGCGLIGSSILRGSITKKISKHYFVYEKSHKNIQKIKKISNKVSANFLLRNFDKCKLTASNIEKKLQKKGLILRETKTYKIKNCLRLTIGNNRENKFFLKSVKNIFKNV